MSHPLLSSPRCWTHRQPQERGGGLVPGPGPGSHRSPDRAVHAPLSHAPRSLRRGLSVLQVLQALQAAEHTARPAGAEPCFFVLTTGTTSSSSAKQAQFLSTPLPPTKPRGAPIVPAPSAHKGLLQGLKPLIKMGILHLAPGSETHLGMVRPCSWLFCNCAGTGLTQWFCEPVIWAVPS